MKILTVDNDNFKEAVLEASAFLSRGGVIVYPTETVYGLGCDATDADAVRRINALKGSDASKQLLVLVADLAMAEKYASFGPAAAALARSNWPGALTLILPTTEAAKEQLHADTIGLRLSSSVLATTLAAKLGKPLVSTSANLSGRPAARSGGEVSAVFAGRSDAPDSLLDAGLLPSSLGSTIVDCTGATPMVVRQGDVKIYL